MSSASGSGNGVQIPENLFKAIDKIHAESSAIFKSLDAQALDLISPNRGATGNSITTLDKKTVSKIKL